MKTEQNQIGLIENIMSETNKLTLIYDKRQKDFVVKYPNKPDGNLVLHHLLGDNLHYIFPMEGRPKAPFNYETINFIKELEKRGYDPKTINFSISKKKTD
jgi:hypothetical protein